MGRATPGRHCTRWGERSREQCQKGVLGLALIPSFAAATAGSISGLAIAVSRKGEEDFVEEGEGDGEEEGENGDGFEPNLHGQQAT